MLLATEAIGLLADDAEKQIEHMHETDESGGSMEAKSISPMENAYAEGSDWANDRPKSLTEFDRGYEGTMSATAAPKKNPGKMLKRLAGQASAVAALLSAIDALPAEEQEISLLMCARLTDALARGIDAFVGELA